MKNILCYGDSNTFGWDPALSRRLEYTGRWPRVMERELGDGFTVFEEGLPGRTTVHYDPVMNLISGADYLYPCLFSHQPLDMVVVMLGTNDLKYLFNTSPEDVVSGLERIVRIIQNFESNLSQMHAKVFLIAPPQIGKPVMQFTAMFREAPEKSRQLAALIARLAKQYDALFLDAAEHVFPHPADGLHLDAAAHEKLGKLAAGEIGNWYLRQK